MSLHYQVFIVCIWPEQKPQPGIGSEVRFTIEDCSTGRRYGFTSWAELAPFLRRQMAQNDDEGGDVFEVG